MHLRWTETAATDLERIADYLFEKTPQHAERIIGELYRAPVQLLNFPALGRPGRAEGTRELVLTPLPYVIVYIRTEDIIYIARILHGAQRWP